jgi:hypothetical protein
MAIYCPECASAATGDVKYCKKCGASLRGGAEALQSRNPDERFDWSRTWVAGMLLTEDERARRRAALEIPGRPEDLVAVELKEVASLQKEIKNGIITAFSGIGLTIFLLIFMGTVAAMQNDSKTAMLLNGIWAAGLIPIFVGVGMLVNAFFVSRHFSQYRQNLLRSVFASGAPALREPARTTGELPALDAPPSEVPSVVEHTTYRLTEPEQVLRGKARRE